MINENSNQFSSCKDAKRTVQRVESPLLTRKRTRSGEVAVGDTSVDRRPEPRKKGVERRVVRVVVLPTDNMGRGKQSP